MATITLKNISADLHRELKKRAEGLQATVFDSLYRQLSALGANIGD